MLSLFGALAAGAIKIEWLELGGGFLTKHLAFFFVPVTVGVMGFGATFARAGAGIGLIVFTVGAIVLTIGAYRFVVVALLLLVRIDVDAYEPEKTFMTFLLGPATVALAIVCAHAFRLGQLLEATLAAKSTTTAIAIEVARIVHGDPALAAGFGTAQAATESELSGAVAGVSLGIGAILTSAFAPLPLRIFGSEGIAAGRLAPARAASAQRQRMWCARADLNRQPRP